MSIVSSLFLSLAIIQENNTLEGRSVEFGKSYVSHKKVAIKMDRI